MNSAKKNDNIRTTLDYANFDLIASGAKKVEFREAKPYWDRRLMDGTVKTITFSRGYSDTTATYEVIGVHRLRVTLDEEAHERVFTEIPLAVKERDSVYAIHLGKQLGK